MRNYSDELSIRRFLLYITSVAAVVATIPFARGILHEHPGLRIAAAASTIGVGVAVGYAINRGIKNAVHRIRVRERKRRFCCTVCGYDRRCSAHRCPECGTFLEDGVPF
jgi:hypothetical protein